jgi:hypothetical protein
MLLALAAHQPRVASRTAVRMDQPRDDEQARLLQRMTEQRAQGKTDAQILESMVADELAGTGIELPTDAPPALPLRGDQWWGRWAQSPREIYLEIFVPEDTAAKAVSCEVQVGFLDVRVADAPLLSGRLAQAVMPGEVDWVIDDNRDENDESTSDGRRVVCINLQKREPSSPDADMEPLFASLRVDGREVGAPGLVPGRYVPPPPRVVSSEAQEGSYGGFDGTAPDMRGGEEIDPF